MIKEHPIFIPPIDSQQKIWRYMDFTKYVDMLNTNSLFFTRSDFFEDIFEGSLTKSTVELRTKQFDQMIKEGKLNPQYTPEFWQKLGPVEKQKMAINCWHMNEHESAAMWKLYIKSNEGIAIQSTYNRLINSFKETDIDIQAGIVKYVDYEKDIISYGNGFSAFVHKRKSFEHERELRCIIWQSSGANKDKVNLESGGINVKNNLVDLIENVFVSPDSPIWFTRLVHDITRKFNLTIPIINSRLNDKPIY